MKRISLLVMALYLAATALFAQDSALPPFVSRLRAISGDQGITLTWQDSEKTEGPYLIYRHTEEIDDASFAEATLLASIAPGTQMYVDAPDNEGPHYYAVLASDNDGTIYTIFVPYRNKTTRGLRARINTVPEIEILPISGISARTAEQVVIISYSATNGEDLVVYRSTKPLTAQDDLVDAVLIETIEASSSPYSDRPLPGVEYYYGIFYDENLRTGSAEFAPGKNVLSIPVSIELEEEEEAEVQTAAKAGRVRPLPFLMLSSTVDTGETLKAGPHEASVVPVALDEETQAAVGRLLSASPAPSQPERDPEWLSQDDGDGVFYSLLNDYVSTGKWDLALQQLDVYMQTRRTEQEEQRVYFYKGECYYFLGDYEQSFVHFIFAEDDYYPQVQPWLDELIRLLGQR